jgi:muramoyltetrapeptide carboxypeptidase
VVGRPYGYTLEQTQLLMSRVRFSVRGFHFPVLFGADIGHTQPMLTLGIGARVRISSEEGLFQVLESSVL